MCLACERAALFAPLTVGLGAVSTGRRGFLRAAAAATLVGAVGTRVSAAPAAADVILRRGSIRTMAGAPGTHEAVAIGRGRILAVGSNAEIAAFASPATRVVDLDGRTVLPGLIDPHHHAVLAALIAHTMLDIGRSACRMRAAALAALAAAAAKTEPGRWIAAAFYDDLLQGGKLTGADLDAVTTRHPLFVLGVNGHAGVANAAAFARVGIGPEVDTIPGGGRFGRGADGRHDGSMEEQPALLRFLAAAVPAPTPAAIAEALARWTARAAAAGLTLLHEPGTIKPEWVEGLSTLSNSLDVRLSASFATDSVGASRAFAALGPPGRARRVTDSRLSFYGMKFWADGSNQVGSAAQTKPYLGRTDRGKTDWTVGEMTRMCREAKEAGWSILVHCQGDAAIDDVLEAIEQAYGPHPATGVNRLEHATMARQDQLARMQRLGVEPSFIPDFVHLYGAAYRDTIFGAERGEFMVPAGAAARAGIAFSLHSDAPATGLPINPLRSVQTAVTRACDTDGSVVGAGLAVSVESALRAITAAAARHVGLDDAIGTLEPGKEADLTILESDPVTTEPGRIAAIEVSETWIAGERTSG